MKKGFTLVEMVIYMGALVLLIGTVATLLLWMIRANNQVHIRNELVVNVEQAFALMANEIREAQGVYTPTTTLSQLSLQTRKSVPASETSTYIDFFRCGTRLCLKREFQAPIALTSENIEIQSLEFTHVKTGPASSIQMVVEASYLTSSVRVQATASLRAY